VAEDGESNTATVTHIAANDILIAGRRLRQRCAWCGAVLIDLDLTRVAVQVEPGEEPEAPATWPVGRLVRVAGEGCSFTYTTVLDETDELPDDACGKVDDEVTR
jgi:hypothetical protein